MQGNLHELTDQELDRAAVLAEAKHDHRSRQAVLAEIKRRQDQEMSVIRQVAEQYSEARLRQ